MTSSKRHPRFHMHFTPTSRSWLNLIERFFAEITRKRIRRGVFRSVLDLEVAIYRYLAEHNEHPKPFVWTAKASCNPRQDRAREASGGVRTIECGLYQLRRPHRLVGRAIRSDGRGA